MKLRIVQNMEHPRGAVYHGEELVTGVVGIDVKLRPDRPPAAVLVVYPSVLNLEDVDLADLKVAPS